MDKLKIYSAYLPFEVKVSYNSIDYIGVLKSIDTFRNQVSFFSKHLFEQIEIEDVKPILFSLEDLTKEITIGGETFVPFDELIKIKNVRLRVEKYENGDKKLLNINTFSFSLFDFEYKIIEKLLEWKFNVFNLPEIEYIKVTEENNPYK